MPLILATNKLKSLSGLEIFFAMIKHAQDSAWSRDLDGAINLNQFLVWLFSIPCQWSKFGSQ